MTEAEFYSKLCDIIDRELCKTYNSAMLDDILYTSPQARECANKVVELVKEFENRKPLAGINH